MTLTCEYCRSTLDEGSLKCKNCGAPVDLLMASGPDFRVCPYCSRKLISLGSLACNHCGRRLPDSYLKFRESTRRRIEEMAGQSRKTNAATPIDFSTEERKGDRGILPSIDDLIDFLT